MKPVMMDRMTSDVDAYRAAVASILELGLNDVPTFDGLAAGVQWDAWMASELNMMVLRLDPDASVPWGLWIARLDSPYPGYRVHSIVCAGCEALHDPHPEPQEYTVRERIRAMELMVPLDPSVPSGPLAWSA